MKQRNDPILRLGHTMRTLLEPTGEVPNDIQALLRRMASADAERPVCTDRKGTRPRST
jgi:hypothetical protein